MGPVLAGSRVKARQGRVMVWCLCSCSGMHSTACAYAHACLCRHVYAFNALTGTIQDLARQGYRTEAGRLGQILNA